MQNPADFSKFNPNTQRQAAYFLDKEEPNFKWRENEEILEIGCADGSISQRVLFPFLEKNVKNLRKLICADVFPLAIEIAKSMNENPKIEFVEMDFGDVKVGEKYSENFDKIFAFYCFHLVKPEESWPKNVFNMLKPGGQVFGTMVPAPNFHTDVVEDQLADTKAPWFSHIPNKPDGMTFYGDKPLEAISKMITDVGLIINSIQIESIRNTFENREFLEKTIKSYSFLVKYVPEELKNDYLKDFVDRIFQKIKKEEDGSYSFDFKIVSFVATKA